VLDFFRHIDYYETFPYPMVGVAPQSEAGRRLRGTPRSQIVLSPEMAITRPADAGLFYCFFLKNEYPKILRVGTNAWL
jgi:hypothetical protein